MKQYLSSLLLFSASVIHFSSFAQQSQTLTINGHTLIMKTAMQNDEYLQTTLKDQKSQLPKGEKAAEAIFKSLLSNPSVNSTTKKRIQMASDGLPSYENMLNNLSESDIVRYDDIKQHLGNEPTINEKIVLLKKLQTKYRSENPALADRLGGAIIMLRQGKNVIYMDRNSSTGSVQHAQDSSGRIHRDPANKHEDVEKDVLGEDVIGFCIGGPEGAIVGSILGWLW